MKKLVPVFLLLVSFSALGQQEFQFGQLIATPSLTNPAAGGMMNVGEVHLGNRMQYVGVEGRPMTTFLSLQSKIKLKRRKKTPVLEEMSAIGKTFYSVPQRTIGNKLVAGFVAMNDQIGPFTKNHLKANLAVHLPINQRLNAGIGLGLGWSNFGINESKVRLIEENDNAYTSYIGTTKGQNYIDANAGLVIYNDRLYIGFSGSQLFGNRIVFNDTKTSSSFRRHLYFMASYRMDLGKKYGLEPIVQVKKTGDSPLSAEIAGRLHYLRLGYVSLSYRTQSAIGIGFGVNVFSHFQFGYQFEFGNGVTQKFGNTSHEIRLGFLFGKKRQPKEEVKEDAPVAPVNE